MNIFPLFLPDFRAFIKSKAFKSEENVHPIFYYERDEFIRFYKPVEHIIYITTILKDLETEKAILPEDIDIKQLVTEFSAIELPSQPDRDKLFNGTIT